MSLEREVVVTGCASWKERAALGEVRVSWMCCGVGHAGCQRAYAPRCVLCQGTGETISTLTHMKEPWKGKGKLIKMVTVREREGGGARWEPALPVNLLS